MGWRTFLAAGVAVTAVFAVAPAGGVLQAVIFIGLCGATLIALGVGVRRHRPQPTSAWVVLLAALALYWVASVGWLAYPLLSGRPLPFPSVLDPLFWTAYLGWFVFLSIVVRRRSRGDRGAVWDAVLLAVGVGVLGWEFLIEPAVKGPFTTTQVAAIAYPVLATLIAAAAVRAAVTRVRLTTVQLLLLGWVALEVVADAWYGLDAADGVTAYSGWWLAGWLLSLTLLGALGLHPDLASVSAAPDGERSWERRTRFAVLLFAAVAPLIAVVVEVSSMDHLSGGHDDTLVLLAIGVVAIVAVMARMALAARDLSEEQALRRQVEHAALHDQLTGLSNRGAFDLALQRALTVRHSSDRSAMVLMADLDGFKGVNDTYGHEAGDELLREIARRLTVQVRDADTVARLGGDEFAVVIDDIDVTEGLGLADRLSAAISEPIDIGPATPAIGVSVGLYRCEPDDSPDDVMRRADAAMYAAKAEGGGLHLYAPDRHREFLDRYQLELQLRAAPAAGELVLEYQPIYRLDGRTVVAAEALVRWQHPERGLLQPGGFIDVAETSGAIIPIGRWVLHQACRDAARWQQGREAADGICVAVNVSRRQLNVDSIVTDVAEALEASGLPASLLTLEVTETALADDVDDMIGVMHQLRTLGVKIALDDFGSGYSSLHDLQRMPIDVLKIDRGFVSGIARTREEWTLAAAMVGLASSLDKRTLAEGIEDPAQLAHLRSLGCELGQGYLLARPMPVQQLTKLLEADRQSDVTVVSATPWAPVDQ